MGYYTDYTVYTYPDKYIKNVVERINELEDYEIFDIEEINEYDTQAITEESQKWYDYQEQCLEISKEFPTLLICVEGEGEETGDIWRKDFMNGEVVNSWTLQPDIPPPPQELIDKASDPPKTAKEQLAEKIKEISEEQAEQLLNGGAIVE